MTDTTTRPVTHQTTDRADWEQALRGFLDQRDVPSAPVARDASVRRIRRTTGTKKPRGRA